MLISCLLFSYRVRHSHEHPNQNPSYDTFRCCQVLLGPNGLSSWESKVPSCLSVLTRVHWQGWTECSLPKCRLYLPLQRQFDRQTLQKFGISNAIYYPWPCSSDSPQCVDGDQWTCCTGLTHQNHRHWNVSCEFLHAIFKALSHLHEIGTAISNNWRFPEHCDIVRTKYSDKQAKVPLSHLPSSIHSSFQSCNHFFHWEIQIYQPCFPFIVHLQ